MGVCSISSVLISFIYLIFYLPRHKLYSDYLLLLYAIFLAHEFDFCIIFRPSQTVGTYRIVFVNFGTFF